MRTYEKLKTRAEKNLVLFAINVYGESSFTKEDLINVLLRSKHGEKGEMYLGYKEYPSVVKYLKNIIYEEIYGLKRKNHNQKYKDI
ncbi:hypothetical protein KJ953_02570 [Patescibacteria group bacterium]|nr:hypothetical protein [Patescibacteria group bacterium]